MNLTQLKADGYRVFNRQRNDNKEANIVALQYIESLAVRTNTNIASWNLLEIFAGEGRREYDLLKDKNAINKIFFEREAQIRESGDDNIQQIKSMISARANEIAQVNRQKRSQALRSNYNRKIARSLEYMNEAEGFLAAANLLYRDLLANESQTSNMADEVVGVMRANFWRFRDFNGSSILYETVSDIILTEVNPAADLNLRVNLGKFIAEIALENCSLKVFHLCRLEPAAPRVQLESYFHPHVASSGNVCWGDLKTRATAHQSKGELIQLMECLAALLTSYSPTNPYIALATFARKQREMETAANNAAAQSEEIADAIAGIASPNAITNAINSYAADQNITARMGADGQWHVDVTRNEAYRVYSMTAQTFVDETVNIPFEENNHVEEETEEEDRVPDEYNEYEDEDEEMPF